MSRIKISAVLFALVLAAGCKAQVPPSANDAALNRRIEVMVRSQYNVPQDYTVTFGERKPSQVAGFQSLPVTLSRGDHKTQVEFLLANDGKSLGRLETFDLSQDPLFNIHTDGRPTRGSGPVTIVNFDDLECPYCARMHETLFHEALSRYKDQIRIVYKDDPLVDIHPWAMHASINANCLAKQSADAYWNFVDYVHGHGQEVSGDQRSLAKANDNLNRIAREQASSAHLDAAKLDACLQQQDESAVRASMHEAEQLHIDGTPALFIDGERINGAMPAPIVWMVIDRALKAHGIEPPPAPVTAPATAASGR